MSDRKLDRTFLEAETQPVKVFGDPGAWECLAKASLEGQWMKITKAVETPEGCLVQVTTLEISPDGARRPAESVTFIPQATLANLRAIFSTPKI